MVLNFQLTLDSVIVISAFLTVVCGIILLNTLFQNKLKELFSDTKFFIFFFLVFGYSLYALGELSWYLIFKVFEQTPSAGMPDFYWVSGTLIMLLSFLVLSKTLYKSYGQRHKLFPLSLVGAVLLFLVMGVVATIGSGGFLSYYYPVVSSLILIVSANLLLFFKNLEPHESNLVYLFFGNVGFFIGDLIYTYLTPREIYGFLGLFADVSYFFGYSLSAFAFLTVMLKFRLFSQKNRGLRN